MNYQPKIKKVGEVLEKMPKLAGVLTKNYREDGEFPIVDQGQLFIAGYTDDKTSLYKGELPVIVFGDHTRTIKFIDFKFAVGADGIKILKPIPVVYVKYLYYFLQSAKMPTRGYARHFKLLKELEIPLPIIDEQKKIVERIEQQFAKIDEAARLRAESLAATEKILPAALYEIFEEGKKKGWEERELGEISPVQKKTNMDLLPYVGMEDIEGGTGCFLGAKHPKKVKSNTFYFDENCLLYGRLRPYLNKVLLPDFKGHCSTELFPLVPDQKLILRKYLFYLMTRQSFIDQAMKTAGGSRMPRADMKKVIKFKIPLPPLDEQKAIVKKLDLLSAKIGKLRVLQLAQQKSLKELKQSILYEAFNLGVE